MITIYFLVTRDSPSLFKISVKYYNDIKENGFDFSSILDVRFLLTRTPSNMQNGIWTDLFFSDVVPPLISDKFTTNSKKSKQLRHYNVLLYQVVNILTLNITSNSDNTIFDANDQEAVKIQLVV